jgi:hypothetical protein
MPEKKIKFCFLKPGGGEIKVKFKAGISLAAGADFRIYASDGKTELDNFKMSAENYKYDLKKINLTAEKLNRAYLVWQALVCATNPRVSEGVIEVEIQQDGKPCTLTFPGQKDLKNIPPCSMNNPAGFNDSLMFVLKTE